MRRSQLKVEKDLKLKAYFTDKKAMSEAKELQTLDESLGMTDDSVEIDSQTDLEERLAERITGRLDGLRHTILSLIVEGRYDTAIAEISFYQNSEYKLPVFKNRAERYFNHAEELIRAIESKTKFCQTRTITRSQKHQLYMMVLKHFNDLAESLKKVERIENDIRVADLKSTVWVLKALVASIGFIILFGMILEAFPNMKDPAFVVTDDIVGYCLQLLGM